MHIQINGQVTINASTHKVWRVVAHEFDQIGQWATAIAASEAIIEGQALAGATCSGRICSAPGYGDVQETFTYYDEDAMRFGYIAAHGLPSFVHKAENNWAVQAVDTNTSVVNIRGEIDLNLIPGLFLAPLFKFQMNRLGQQTIEELKYYLEHDQPHPRKQKQMQRVSAKA